MQFRVTKNYFLSTPSLKNTECVTDGLIRQNTIFNTPDFRTG